jgi:hypothetical protein
MTESSRPSYEQAREELADVVRQLEQGGPTLEQSLACGSAVSSWPASASPGWTAPPLGSTQR